VLHIRTATPADAKAIAALHTASWRIAYRGILSDDYLQHELDQDRLSDWLQRLAAPLEGQLVIVAEDERHTLLGFACAYAGYDPEVGTLVENLHAHPEHKNAGTGRQLLSHLARWSLAQHPDDLMHLWVLTANTPAIGFYQRMGARSDMTAIWDAPGGTQVPELRFTWYQPADLIIT
jgi:GNAT superfamily N-acetyltransferase